MPQKSVSLRFNGDEGCGKKLPLYAGLQKAAEQLGINYCTIADWRKARSQKAKEKRIASDKTPLNESSLAMQCEIQEQKNAKKSVRSVASMCKTLKGTKTGFYKWKQNRNKVKRRQLILVQIRKIHSQDAETET